MGIRPIPSDKALFAQEFDRIMQVLTRQSKHILCQLNGHEIAAAWLMWAHLSLFLVQQLFEHVQYGFPYSDTVIAANSDDTHDVVMHRLENELHAQIKLNHEFISALNRRIAYPQFRYSPSGKRNAQMKHICADLSRGRQIAYFTYQAIRR
jgi:hypothetical protein